MSKIPSSQSKTKKTLWAVVGAAVALALLVACGTYYYVNHQLSSTSPGFGRYKKAAVAADAKVCSTIGKNILEKGGSAVDAGIAGILCAGVVNAHSTGIGGGHFMTIYAAPKGSNVKEFNTILGREWAPLAATQDMYVNNSQASRVGGLAIGVPGEIKGLYTAWEMYGKLEWSDLVRPTIDLLENGYVVTRALAHALQRKNESIYKDPVLMATFVEADFTLKDEGDVVTNPTLARTMTTIANDPMSFYTGALAEDIVADIRDHNGIITLEDLKQYKATVAKPLRVNLENGKYSVYAPQPPSSGVVFQYILALLDAFGLSSESLKDTDTKIETYHKIVEAMKFAYGKRSALGDANHVDVTEILNNMTSQEFARATSDKITDTTHELEYYEPAFEIVEDQGTSHLSVLAEDGSAFSITSTINTYFGSTSAGSRTGIIFNNEMDDFSTPGHVNAYNIPASPSNYIRPGKMPMSSMCPTIITDENDRVVFLSGAAGGSKITTNTAYVTINNLWFDKQIDVATNDYRLHHQLMPMELMYEQGFDQDVLEGLQQRGHVLKEFVPTTHSIISVVQSISNRCPSVCNDITCFWEACVYAQSDDRKGGSPDGY